MDMLGITASVARPNLRKERTGKGSITMPPQRKQYNYRAMGRNTQQINIYPNGDAGSTEPQKSTSISYTKSLISIGAVTSWYVYFFGYTFFKSKMHHLGFEATLPGSNIHEIFYQAFEGLTVGLLGIFEGLSSALWQALSLDKIIIPLTFTISLAGMFIFKAEKPETSIRESFRNWMLEQNESITGKIKNALIFTTSVFLTQVLLYLMLLLIAFLWLYLSIPEAIGSFAAFKQLDNFSCEPQFEKNPKKRYHVSCTNIVLKDNRHYVGMIVYADDKNLYFINKSESRTIPIADIKDNYRDIIARPDKSNP